MNIYELFEKSAQFHGHKCPGLAIGVRAAYEAMRILEIEFSLDEEIVCISENDACGVDGIQVVLGCSAGKGNLIYKLRGKQAFSIYNRKNNKSVRLIKKSFGEGLSREEKQLYTLEAPFDQVFEITEVKFELPEEARIFKSVNCEECGELTAEPFIRLDNNRKLCFDCYNHYSRF